MKDQEYPDAPEAAAERMVLGRMVLRIEDSGRAVLEAMLPYKAVSADAACPPAAPDENPHQGADCPAPEANLIGGCQGVKGGDPL